MSFASSSCLRIESTGLSAAIASWKIHAIFFPLISFNSLEESSKRFFPSKKTFPEEILAPGSGKSLRILIAVTLLPQPDSPTNAKNSPFFISKETLSVTATERSFPKATETFSREINVCFSSITIS